MKANIYHRDEDAGVYVGGTIQTVGGKAVPDSGAKWVTEYGSGPAVMSDDQTRQLTPADGDEYVAALPYALHGSRVWAALADEDGSGQP